MKFTKLLNEVNKNDVDIAGGKAASLGEMLSIGILVPKGMVLLSSAFDYCIEENNLSEEIDAALDLVNPKAIHTIENASERIQKLILSAEIPNVVKNDIEKSVNKINASFLAIRSSATDEDGSEHAWAGQLDTYLNVTRKDILTKIKSCWASLFTPRAIFYRFEKGLGKKKISVAIVIQEMVDSEKAGIAFSVHPITEDRNQMVIEAAYGLGEGIVSGSITPDNYIIEKASRKIIDTRINKQKKALKRSKSGENQWVILDEKSMFNPILSSKEIFKLTSEILKIENHYKFPVDIEWAFAKGVFYITQSRPITTIGPMSGKGLLNNRKLQKLFAREYSVQYCEGSLRSLGGGAAGHIPQSYLSQCYLPEGKNEAVYFDPNEWGLFQSHLKGVADKKLARDRFLKNFHYYGKKYIKSAKKGSSGNLRKISLNKLVSSYNDYVNSLNLYTCYLWKGFWLNEIISKKAMDFLLTQKIPPKLYDAVIASLFSPKKKAGILLLQETLMKEKKRSKKLNQILIKKLIKKYAWMSCLDIHNNPWKEQEFNKYYKEMRAVPSSKIPYARALNVINANSETKTIFDTVREFVYVKDMRDVYRRQAVYFSIPMFEEIARRLRISRHDLAFMTNEEIIGSLLGRMSIQKIPYKKRKNGFLIFWENKGIKVFNDKKSINRFLEDVLLLGDENRLFGQIACRGIVSGPAKIVRVVSDLKKVKKGDILVAITTHPDFIPAMQRAKAFITDEGGVTSHAAIVAREMEKPCIVGVQGATNTIKDGDIIQVDANNGIVKLNK